MQVAEYIFKQLADWNVKHVFMVSGGGALFLNAALGREKRIKYVCNHHEQASTMAAEGYARITNTPGIVCVTSGPGGTNTLTGVLGAWLDSVPLLIISGQVKRETLSSRYPELNLRQLGDQEFDIIKAVRCMTKYAICVTDPESIVEHLDMAWRASTSGRPGPVWLDIPLDVQSAQINVEELSNLDTMENKNQTEIDAIKIRQAFDMIAAAERPVVIVGRGVKCAGADKEFVLLAERLNIPVLTAPSGIDIINSGHRLFFGRPGVIGGRAANFILQNADVVLALGTRMNLRVIGYNWQKVCPFATKIMVDADPGELKKPSFPVDLPICGDAGAFIRQMSIFELPIKSRWLEYCKRITKQYPIVDATIYKCKNFVNSYVFAELLGGYLNRKSIVVTGNGTAYTSTFQAIKLPEEARMFANVGCASMGYDLPAAIGAQLADECANVIVLTGDGSIQMNLQELERVKSYRLPIKIFVYNNNGYLSIKHTQNSFSEGDFVGADPKSGVSMPNMEKISAAYGIRYFKVTDNCEAELILPEIMNCHEAVICELMMDPMEKLYPKSATIKMCDGTLISRPLEDMVPLLDRDEYADNMIGLHGTI